MCLCNVVAVENKPKLVSNILTGTIPNGDRQTFTDPEKNSKYWIGI